MRCKKHVTDLSSTIGVCASCLRERLFVLIAAQVQENRRKSDSNPPPPPPLVFPRSVSPYISRRKSDTTVSSWTDTQHQLLHPHSLPDQRFYSTPQVGPSGSLTISASASYFKQQNKKNGRFSLFANLFRSKSDKLESEISGPSQIVANSRARDSCTAASSSSSSPSWFSAILSGRGKKQNRTFSVDESAAIGGGHRRVCRNHPERGMSPNRYPEEEEEHYHNGSSGYSSESSQQWKQTPRRTPAWMGPGRRLGGGKSGQCRNVSGMGFCLSPLVRASPSSHWNQKGITPEKVVSGETRVVPVKPHLSNAAASFCKNRSRKLADFGRFHQNR